jgi:hypothetical protein
MVRPVGANFGTPCITHYSLSYTNEANKSSIKGNTGLNISVA